MWSTTERRVETATLGIVLLGLAVLLRPDLWFRTTTLSGGDYGAHILTASWLHNHLGGGLWTWSSSWFAGFVPWAGYFPGGLLVAAVLGFVAPITIALKLVIVASVLALPLAAWGMGRLARLPFPVPPLLAVATVPFMLDRFQIAEGGNLLSTLAGEVNYVLALSLMLLLVGLTARGLDTGRRQAAAAALIGAILLCHLVVALFAAMAVVSVVALRPSVRAARALVISGATGVAIAAAYLAPFLSHLALTTTEGQKANDTAYVAGLLPFTKSCPAPAPVTNPAQWVPRFSHTCGFGSYYANQTGHLLIVAALAAGGLAYAIARRRTVLLALAVAAAGAAIGFVVIGEGSFWNGRLLPLWYLTLYLLAAAVLGEVAPAAQAALGRRLRRLYDAVRPPRTRRRRPAPAWASPAWVVPAAPLVVLAAAVIVLGPGGGIVPGVHADDPHDAPRVLPNFVAYDLSGYQAKAAWPEYRGVIDTMRRVGASDGCGRAYADLGGHRNLASYGSDWAMFLLPYWTHGCITSVDGLYLESSATSPMLGMVESELAYIQLNPKRELPYQPFSVRTGVQHLRLLGVRYYLALDDAAKTQADGDPDLTLLATSGPWKVYGIAGAALVSGLDREPIVLRGGGGHWLGAGLQTYLGGPLYAAGGPSQWPRAAVHPRRGATADQQLTIDTASPASVEPAIDSTLVYRSGHISFDVDRIGAPVVVRESWYPDWHVRGARGPWRVTPNFMVVVPTSRHVVLTFGPDPAAVGGLVVSALAVALAALLAFGGRRSEQLLDLLTLGHGG